VVRSPKDHCIEYPVVIEGTCALVSGVLVLPKQHILSHRTIVGQSEQQSYPIVFGPTFFPIARLYCRAATDQCIMLIQSVARSPSVRYKFNEEGGGVRDSIAVTGQGGGGSVLYSHGVG